LDFGWVSLPHLLASSNNNGALWCALSGEPTSLDYTIGARNLPVGQGPDGRSTQKLKQVC